MQRGPGNVFTILDMTFSKSLRGASMLRWMTCEPLYIIGKCYHHIN